MERVRAKEAAAKLTMTPALTSLAVEPFFAEAEATAIARAIRCCTKRMLSWKMTVLANIVARYSTTAKCSKRQRPDTTAASNDSNKGGHSSGSTEINHPEPPAKGHMFDIYQEFFDNDAVGSMPSEAALASGSSHGYASMWFCDEPAPPRIRAATQT